MIRCRTTPPCPPRGRRAAGDRRLCVRVAGAARRSVLDARALLPRAGVDRSAAHRPTRPRTRSSRPSPRSRPTRWKWTRPAVRTFLDGLATGGFLTLSTTAGAHHDPPHPPGPRAGPAGPLRLVPVRAGAVELSYWVWNRAERRGWVALPTGSPSAHRLSLAKTSSASEWFICRPRPATIAARDHPCAPVPRQKSIRADRWLIDQL